MSIIFRDLIQDAKAMSYFERALEADRMELPECRCGQQMRLCSIDPLPDHSEACIFYRCSVCQHEIRLTVWAADVVN
jgi:hypothetical protein